MVIAVVSAFVILRAAWCSFTWGRFHLVDYGLYSGALWNTTHGHPFQVLNGETYLNRHLTFSLALLVPFVWITDHPFLLSFAQWMLAVAGGVLLVASARKQNVS